MFAFVLGLAFLLLMVTFRSVAIPLMSIGLNLLSVGAAYGLLTLIFQDGHLSGLLGFSPYGGIVTWMPLFLFVLLFGLSMDYHVFILSRIRELRLRGWSTPEAITGGIGGSAGVVTSAAVIMVAVFSIFATLSLIEFKMFGVGDGRGRAHRRHRGPRRAHAGGDVAARRAQLVPAGLAVLAARPAKGGPGHRRARPEGDGRRGHRQITTPSPTDGPTLARGRPVRVPIPGLRCHGCANHARLEILPAPGSGDAVEADLEVVAVPDTWNRWWLVPVLRYLAAAVARSGNEGPVVRPSLCGLPGRWRKDQTGR